MLIKIKSVTKSEKKGKIDVSYRVNGILVTRTIAKTDDVEKAITALETPKKK